MHGQNHIKSRFAFFFYSIRCCLTEKTHRAAITPITAQCAATSYSSKNYTLLPLFSFFSLSFVAKNGILAFDFWHDEDRTSSQVEMDKFGPRLT